MNEDDVKAGVPVCLETEPARIGILTGRKKNMSKLVLAQVNWGANTQFEDIEYLRIKPVGAPDDLHSMVRESQYGTIQDMRRRMTYEKLQGTLTDIFYSMAAAQIDFYPHQFKPVLRFIDSPTNRILIADEVGLGKTIEAGLIWTECQARFDARRLLVVCKPTLCPKWQKELRERFQLDVEVADLRRLTDLMNELDRVGSVLPFAAICSYRALLPTRNDKYALAPVLSGSADLTAIDNELLSQRGRLLKRVLSREAEVPFADLVVFDEAHEMRNTATATHSLGRLLSRESGASLCLTATPVHNKARDLFALLQMVDPDYFQTEYVFEILRDQNQPLVVLLNLLSRPGVKRGELQEQLRLVDQSEYLSKSPLLPLLHDMIQQYAGDVPGAVAAFRHAEKMNLFSSYISRTRKIQTAIEGRVQRRPIKLTVELTPEEMKFYRAVLRFIRTQVRKRGESVTSFHTMPLALRMASCMPVMAKLIRDGRWGGVDELIGVGEDEWLEYEENVDEDMGTLKESLDWIRHYDFEKNDTKYKALMDGLAKHAAREKVIVFAFFKDTIRYLEKRLAADGFRTASLTGDIKELDKRTAIIEAFESNDAHILLCSEVGSEGIDLQFCRTVVNYDLPWNPMRVEQRIGRVDRIGQRAKSITIINFCIEGTIDGLIYHHLYEKLGIFEQTIGDLEAIIGPAIGKLTTDLLKEDLSDGEAERLIKDAERALEERRTDEADLEKSPDALVAYSDYLAEQVGESRRLGRYVKPSELRLYLSDFFAERFSGCHLDWDTPDVGCGQLTLSYEATASLARFVESKHLRFPSGNVGAGRPFSFALDPEAYDKVRRKNKNVRLVNHLHPLIKWVTKDIEDRSISLHKVVAVGLRSDLLPQGLYFFLVRRLNLKGLNPREHLLYAVQNTETGTVLDGTTVESAINEALDHGESLFPSGVDSMERFLQDLEGTLDETCNNTIEAYKAEMEAKRLIRTQQVKAYYERKIKSAEKQLHTLKLNSASGPRMVKLTEARLDHLIKNREEKIASLDSSTNVRVSADDVVCGLLEME